MRKLILSLLLSVSAFGAANDIKITQRKPDDSGFIERTISPGASSVLTFDSSKLMTTTPLSSLGVGTVTSVNITQPAAGITVSGGPITTSGSLTLALANDLAALEALSGTNTLYYRSGTSAWSAVTVGSGLDFTSGTLSATGGGGGAPTDATYITQTANGSLSNEQALGALSTGILKNTTTTGVLSIAAAGTDYEVPLTFSTGLTRSTNTVTVNTTQNIAKLSNLTSNGFVKTSGGDGTLSVDTATYLTSSTGVSSITGTSNQVAASASTGAVTLSLPQSIHTSATPQFARQGLGVAADGTIPLLISTGEVGAEIYSETGQADFHVTSYGSGGLSGIMHGRGARGTRASPSALLAGDGIGGFGGRGWDGSAWSGSKASIHMITTENWSGTNQGARIRLLTTPAGGTTRYPFFEFTDLGVFWTHGQSGNFDPLNTVHFRPAADMKVTVSETGAGSTMGAISWGGDTGYRSYSAGGSVGSPAATASGRNIGFLSAAGHDGSTWTGSKGLATFRASETWGGSANGIDWVLALTPTGSTTRSDVLTVRGSGVAEHTNYIQVTRTAAAPVEGVVLNATGATVGDGMAVTFQHSGERSGRVYARALSTNIGEVRVAVGNGGSYADAATFTSTGLNSTAIGATTPSTGAFTTTTFPEAAAPSTPATNNVVVYAKIDGRMYSKDDAGTETALGVAGAGTGDVVGPGSATNNALARFDTGTGKLIQNSTTTLSDAGAFALADGVTQVFNPDATNPGLDVGSIAGDPSAPNNGALWYDSSANELTARINGSNVALGAGGGGGSPGGSDTEVQYNDGGAFGGDSGMTFNESTNVLSVTGRVVAGNGSASTPGFGFSAGSGMYASGGGSLQFSQSGTYAFGFASGSMNFGYDTQLTGIADIGDTPRYQFSSTTSNSLLGLFDWHTSGGAGTSLNFHRSKSGTIGTHTTLASGNWIGGLDFAGSDGTRFVPSAAIRVYVDNTVSNNAVPGKIVFYTMTGLTYTETMELSSARLLKLNAYGAGTLTTDSSGNVTATSDERLKDIAGEYRAGLAQLAQIRPIRYHWKPRKGVSAEDQIDTATEYAGFSAQNVQAAMPEAVGVMADGMLTLQDRPLLAAAVNAINELNGRLDAERSARIRGDILLVCAVAFLAALLIRRR